jgi:hypothetical protein
MFFIHHPRVALLTRHLIAMARGFEIRYGNLKVALGTPFAVASDTILGRISPTGLSKENDRKPQEGEPHSFDVTI